MPALLGNSLGSLLVNSSPGADAALGEIYPQGVTIAEQSEYTASRSLGGEQGDPGSQNVLRCEPVGQNRHFKPGLP